MTSITLPVRLEDSTSDTEPIVSTGWRYRVRPSTDYVNGAGDVVLAEWPVGGGWKAFTGATATLLLDPLSPDNPYFLQIQGPTDPTSRDRTSVRREEYRQVVTGTAGGTSWYALTRVSAPGPSGVTYPLAGYDQLVAQIAALQAQINSIVVSGGGASNLAGISDMSANARTFNAAANNAAMRTALQVQPTDSPAFTGNPTAPNPPGGDNDTSIATTAFVTGLLGGGTVTTNSPTFTGTTDLVNLDVSGTVVVPAGSIAQAAIATLVADLALKAPLASPALTGTPTAPTASPGDNDTSVATTAFVTAAITAANTTALAAVPYPFFATGTAYAGRPVTPRPVWWMSWDVAPPATSGTVTSGTGPVVGLDVVFLGVGVVPG